MSGWPSPVEIEITYLVSIPLPSGERRIIGAVSSSLGTLVADGPNGQLILTHNHFGENVLPPGAGWVVVGSPSVVITGPGGASQPFDAGILPNSSMEIETGYIVLPANTISAPVAPRQPGPSSNVSAGDTVQVVEFHDGDPVVTDMQVTSVDVESNSLMVDNPPGVIAPGDSGGGVYFNGIHIGNTWQVFPNGAAEIALNP
jgi:hypothetical protein